MKTALLWKSDYRNEDNAIMIDSSEVSSKISLSNDTVYLFTGMDVNPENEVLLNSLVVEYKNSCDYGSFSDLLCEKEISYEFASDVESPRDILCYSVEDNSVGNLGDYETQKSYEYFDEGSNLKQLWLDESMTETIVEYDDEKGVDLDELDENTNWYYITKFNHAKKYPILAIDGEPETDKYLIEEWSQYQGSHTTGQIVDADWTVEQEIEERRLNY